MQGHRSSRLCSVQILMSWGPCASSPASHSVKDLEERAAEYIALLEETNAQLQNTLKQCIRKLTDLKASVPDQAEWQKMLDALNATIKVGGRVSTQRTLH